MINERLVLSEIDIIVDDEEDCNEDDVYAQLTKKEKQLMVAAAAGKLLLERNNELQENYETLNTEFIERIEAYEAEKCKMKKIFLEKENIYQERIHNLSVDNKSLVQSLESGERKAKMRKTTSGKNIENLTRQNEILKSELDMATTKNKELSLQVQTLKRRIEGRSSTESHYSEDVDMREFKMVNEQVRKLQNEKKNLEETLDDLASEKLSFMEDAERSKEKIAILEQKAKLLEQQILITKSELDQSKISNVQLKEQLEDYIIQASRTSFTASNSLLNELELSLHGENDSPFLPTKLDGEEEFTPKFMSSPERQRNGMVCSNQSNMQTHDSPSKSLSHLENSHESSAMESFERQIAELNNRLNETTKSYEQLYKKYTKTTVEVRNAECTISDLQKQVNYMQRELDMYKGEREILMSQDSVDSSLIQALEDRRRAMKGESEALLQVEQTKSDMVKLNNQLLEAVQQKLALSEQLEMWQVDMAALIEKQLNRNSGKQENKGFRKSKLFPGRWSWSSSTKSN